MRRSINEEYADYLTAKRIDVLLTANPVKSTFVIVCDDMCTRCSIQTIGDERWKFSSFSEFTFVMFEHRK